MVKGVPLRSRAKKEWKRRRDARLAKVWNQPAPGSWFDRLIGKVTTKGKKKHEAQRKRQDVRGRKGH